MKNTAKFIGFTALTAVIVLSIAALSFIGCSDGSGGGPSPGTGGGITVRPGSPKPTTGKSTFTGTASTGVEYTLVVEGATTSGSYTVKTGHTYVLTYKQNFLTKESKGTITSVSVDPATGKLVLGLKPVGRDGEYEAFNITVTESGSIDSFKGTITWLSLGADGKDITETENADSIVFAPPVVVPPDFTAKTAKFIGYAGNTKYTLGITETNPLDRAAYFGIPSDKFVLTSQTSAGSIISAGTVRKVTADSEDNSVLTLQPSNATVTFTITVTAIEDADGSIDSIAGIITWADGETTHGVDIIFANEGDNVSITVISATEITDLASDIVTLSTPIVLSKTGSGAPAPALPKTKEVELEGGEGEWEIAGAGIIYAAPAVGATKANSFTLDAEDARYNVVGKNYLILTVVIDGLTYSKVIPFEIEE